MKSRLIFSSAILAALFIFGSWTWQQVSDREGLIVQLMLDGLNRSHYRAVPIDNDFSSQAYDLYLKRLDYNKRYLTADEAKQLEKYREKLDDLSQRKDFSFFDLSFDMIENGYERAESWTTEILEAPFDFDLPETINLDAEELEWAEDEDALRERWRQLLKYQTLVRVYSMQEEQEKKRENGELEAEKSLEDMEVEARERVRKNYDNTFSRLERLDREDYLSRYIDALAATYDPHTNYFPPKDKENFDIGMAGQLEGIGARLLQTPEGYIKVTEVVPGGPAARQGDLEAEDIILKVGQNTEEPVDVVDMRVDDAVRLIRGKKGTEVRLTVQKPDGTTELISIIRDLVQLEDTYAKSLLLSNEETDKTFGYIMLPKFYADFSGRTNRSSFRDVAIEVDKLKQENVDGIILDLRNNGGGSLQDVVDMGGLFIEQGPIVQVKGRQGAPYIYRDRDPNVQYTGPLVILVNEFSASASEIMAAAMQDYERAIIVGSSRTFGKGTVQRFFSLDDLVRRQGEKAPALGAVKLTTQKFYRINGGATQLRGVVPDVIIPDTYSYLKMGEEEQDYPLKWDEIQPVDYELWPSRGGLRARVIAKSQARVDESEAFQRVEENARRYQQVRERGSYPLSLPAYVGMREADEAAAERFEGLLETDIENMIVHNVPIDVASLEAEPSRMEGNNKWMEEIQKDAYIWEAMQILGDLR